MTYLFLYLIGLILIWYVYKVGWLATLKTVVSVIVPSLLIIVFNVKAGRLLFKSPIIGIISALPTSIFIFRGSKPLVSMINNWLDNKFSFIDIQKDVIDTESYSVEDK
tara:strand:- start:82 stop:405 length:324 start_codon:yes stop_codon:yes gene_type:complete